MLSIRNFCKTFDDFALRDISFDVKEGEYFALLGASGVGKTVLLEGIAGLVKLDSGTVSLDGRDITGEKIQKRNMTLVYQDQNLFPHMTVRQNIGYGLRSKKVKSVEIDDRVEKLAEDVGVRDLLDRRPETLSGGEAQRVVLGRALGTDPRCLLLDEPISSLDAGSRSGLRALLRKLNRRGLTMVHVTHDYEEAVSLASRVAIMEHGRIVQIGKPEEIFHHPKSEFVAGFIGIRNFLKGELRRPSGASGGMAEFITDGLSLTILTDAPNGPGFFTIRSEDITLSNSRQETSARNTFEGTIIDIAPARLGVEVTIDIGVEISALVTEGSVKRLGMECGRNIWASFKATAGKFLDD